MEHNDKYRLSRSELGSSSSINEPEDIGKKYKKFKDLCLQLINENDELKQENSRIKRKFDLEELKVVELESINTQLLKEKTAMKKSLENQKKDFEVKIKALQSIMDEEKNKHINSSLELTKSLRNEVTELTLKTQELQLAKKVHENTINDMKNSGQIIDEQICDSWWCAKHSDLAFIYKKMEIANVNEKHEIDMALKRQRYWCRNNEIRCCVHDRKTGVDKHITPPDCWVLSKN